MSMGYLAAFLEGIVTFISPCLLPLLPVYLAFFAGGEDGGAEGSTARTVRAALCFVLGFAVPFTLMGAFAGTMGSLLLRYQRVLEVLCGCVVVTLGLGYLGVLHIGLFERASGMRASKRRGPLGALLLGMTFAVGWTPCVGTFLASALSLAATSGSTMAGVAMLLCFSLGLGVPFVLSAVLIDQLEGTISWIKAHYELVNRICGILLVVLGVLMATGLFGAWMRLLS